MRAEDPAEEDLPLPQTTRSMLAVFKSMEDVNRPPPTPEEAKKQRASVSNLSRTGSIYRGASSNQPAPTSLNINGHGGAGSDGESYGDEREQHETSEYTNDYEEYNNTYNTTDSRDYDPHGGEFENEPEHNPDTVREEDPNETEQLPEEGTTRNLLAKFQALQAT